MYSGSFIKDKFKMGLRYLIKFDKNVRKKRREKFKKN